MSAPCLEKMRKFCYCSHTVFLSLILAVKNGFERKTFKSGIEPGLTQSMNRNRQQRNLYLVIHEQYLVSFSIPIINSITCYRSYRIDVTPHELGHNRVRIQLAGVCMEERGHDFNRCLIVEQLSF